MESVKRITQAESDVSNALWKPTIELPFHTPRTDNHAKLVSALRSTVSTVYGSYLIPERIPRVDCERKIYNAETTHWKAVLLLDIWRHESGPV